MAVTNHSMLSALSGLPNHPLDPGATQAAPLFVVARGQQDLVLGLRAIFGGSLLIVENRRRARALLARGQGHALEGLSDRGRHATAG